MWLRVYIYAYINVKWNNSREPVFMIIILFLQQYFVCDWAINVDCSTAEGFYSLNDDFGAKIEERSDDQAIEDESGGTLTVAVLFQV